MPTFLREGRRLFEDLGDKEIALEQVGGHAFAHGQTGLQFAVKL